MNLKLGQVEEAKEYFSKATHLDSEYEDALLMLFESILESDTTEEIDQYTKHLDVKEMSPDALHLLGTIEARNENDEKAKLYYGEAEKYLKDNTEFLSDYYYYLTEIRDDKRIDVLNELIKLEPNNSDWQLELEYIRGEEDGF